MKKKETWRNDAHLLEIFGTIQIILSSSWLFRSYSCLFTCHLRIAPPTHSHTSFPLLLSLMDNEAEALLTPYITALLLFESPTRRMHLLMSPPIWI